MARRGRYVFTAARRRALRKAQLASARKRRRRARNAPRRAARRAAVRTVRKELQAGAVGYGRVNKRSATVGGNAGTKIPGTKKRIVVGGYTRIENTHKQSAVDRFVAKHANRAFPAHTRRGKTVRAVGRNIAVKNPAIRATGPKGTQVRLGTSRQAGPTIIIRKGKHKVSQPKSMAGVQQYDRAMVKIAGKRATAKSKKYKPRPQRRRAAAKKRRKT